MKLRRQKPKHTQAMDAIASVTKVWSEWQLGKKASKGVAKAKALRPPSKLKRILSLKWVKVGGAVAVAGGTAAAVGRKLKSDDPAAYTGPPPSAAADVAVPAPDTPAPLAVAPDPATQDRETETVGGDSTLRSNREEAPEPAADPEPVADAAESEPPAPAAAGAGDGAEAVADEPAATEEPAGADAPADAETT
jgi:DNA polymerase-3 subunit gamma/tau